MLDVMIRPETAADRAGVNRVNQRAFGRPDEARLVDTAFMVVELAPGALAGRRGWVRYVPEFESVA